MGVFYVSAGTYTHGARMEVRGKLLRAGSPSLWVPGAELRGVANTVQCFNLLSHLTGPNYYLFNRFILFERVSLCSVSWPGTHCVTQAGFQPEAILLPSAWITGACHYIHFGFFYSFGQLYEILEQFLESRC